MPRHAALFAFLVVCSVSWMWRGADAVYPNLPTGITAITDPTSVPIPPFHGPQCFPQFTSQFPTPVRALIVVGDGSDINGYLGAYKYLSDRGASVETLCIPSQTNIASTIPNLGGNSGALLMSIYYPFATIDCTSTDINVLNDLTVFNLTYIPSGYLATLPMREEGVVPSAIQAFLVGNTSSSSSLSTLVLEGGSVELLIGTGMLPRLNITASNPFPSATPATTAAVLVEVCQNNMDGSVDCGQKSPNTTGVFSFSSNSTTKLFVSKDARDLSRLLPWVAQVAFNYTGDFNFTTEGNHTANTTTANTTTLGNETYDYAPAVNCSDVNTTDLLSTNLTNLTITTLGAVASLLPATHQVWNALGNGKETQVPTVGNVTSQIPGECRNSAGINFCQGSRVSVVVAHGSHDAEVITAAGVFRQLGSTVKLICPDTEESIRPTGGKVFLSSNPAFVPTYQVQCTQFYNRTDMIAESLVVISSGPIATHGRLRMDKSLVRVIQYTGTFSAYGSALALLDTILVGKDEFRPTDIDHSDVSDAPLCPHTNQEMSLLGFNMTEEAISKGSKGVYNKDTAVVHKRDAPTMLFRTPALRRTKVLGGYLAADQIMLNYTQFLAFTIQSLVWENDSSTGSKDGAIIGVLLAACGAVLVSVVVVVFVRARREEAEDKSGFQRLPTEDGSLQADTASMVGSTVFDSGKGRENTFYGYQ